MFVHMKSMMAREFTCIYAAMTSSSSIDRKGDRAFGSPEDVFRFGSILDRSAIRVSTTTMSNRNIPAQYIHHVVSFMLESRMIDSIQSTICMGVPITRKSLYL